MSEWKCDFGFRPLSFWYGTFRSRKELEKYVNDSFLAQVEIPNNRTLRHYSEILFLKEGTVSDLVADQPGSSFYAPEMEKAVRQQKCGKFNAGFLVQRFQPPNKDVERKYHTRKLKHLGFFKTHGTAKSIAEARGGPAMHKKRISVWACSFRNERSLKAHFQWPRFERIHSSKFAKENQLGFQFEEELSELTWSPDHQPVQIKKLLDEQSHHSSAEKEAISELCRRAGFAKVNAIYAAFDYNHEVTVQYSPAANRTENKDCQFVGTTKAGKSSSKKTKSKTVKTSKKTSRKKKTATSKKTAKKVIRMKAGKKPAKKRTKKAVKAKARKKR